MTGSSIGRVLLHVDGTVQSGPSGDAFDSAWLVSLIVLLPSLSVLAAHFMSQDALLLTYLLAGSMAFTSLHKLRTAISDYFFPLLLGSITLSLILTITLTSPYIQAGDIRIEFALFQLVLQSGIWRPDLNALYNSTLSVTILPLIINLVSSLDGTLIFKTVFPAIYSIVPMMLYRIYRKLMGPEASFLSVLFFIFYPTSFIEIAALGRQMIGELLLVLMLWSVMSFTLRKARTGSLLVIILTIGLVVSHYSLAIIYMSIAGFSYVVSRVSGRRSRLVPLSNISLVALSLVVGFCWYLLVAGGAVLQQIASFSPNLLTGLTSDFFNPTSRSTTVLEALGIVSAQTQTLHLVNRALQYVVVLFIVVGFVFYVRKRENTFAARVIVAPMIAAMVLLLGSVALPYAASTLNLSRIYDIMLLFLAPCGYLSNQSPKT